MGTRTVYGSLVKTIYGKASTLLKFVLVIAKRPNYLLITLVAFLVQLVLFLIISPVIPALIFSISARKIDPDYIPYRTEVTIDEESGEKNVTYKTDGNRLFIPQIGVDTKILEGSSLDILRKEEGVWRDPRTATPDQEGNVVLAGHRFQYLPPNTTTFYNLDKIREGDEVKIFWKGVEYKYKVDKISEVQPTDTWILRGNSGIRELTIYTCTPLYTSSRRLVVHAYLST